MAKELRFGRGLEFREAAGEKDGRIGTIRGYAIVYDKWSEDLGGFREIIRAGCFTDTLKNYDQRALVGHDSTMIIGRRSAGTLVLTEDSVGVAAEIAVPDTTAGRDVVVSVKRRDLTGMSFAFDTIEDKWDSRIVDKQTLYERDLIKADLFEVSVVAFPAYADTTVEARSLRSAMLEQVRRRASKDALARRDYAIAQYKLDRWNG